MDKKTPITQSDQIEKLVSNHIKPIAMDFR